MNQVGLTQLSVPVSPKKKCKLSVQQSSRKKANNLRDELLDITVSTTV